jgi:hypothetical protein
VRHEEAFTRLPDLLDDRDDPGLLAHVRECADCQRQLFLLGRVDRMLRERGAASGVSRGRRSMRRRLLAAAAVAAVAAATALALFLPQTAHTHELTLRTASGGEVGQAVIGRSDTRNTSLALTARGLPIDHGQMFVLWAGDAGSSMQVGRFMVDQSGGCRVRFNLPASHAWSRFWVTEAGKQAAVIAST